MGFFSRFRHVVFFLILMPTIVFADDYEVYSKHLELLLEGTPRPSVASVASGFGAGNRVSFFAVSYSDKDLQTDLDDDDGSIIAGVGLGDPQGSLGIEVAIGITSVSTAFWGDGKFADEGNFNLKVHKFVPPLLFGNSASFAIGSSNLTGWGGTVEIPRNDYLVYSENKFVGEYFQYGLAYTLGYGSAVANGESEEALFGGIGIARSDYNGSVSFMNEEVHLSATWYLPNLRGVTINVTRADLFNKNGSERNIFTLGYSYDLGDL